MCKLPYLGCCDGEPKCDESVTGVTVMGEIWELRLCDGQNFIEWEG